MNHKLLNKTLREVNRKLRAELKQVVIELKYTQALYKLERKEKKQ
jgi:hypothetical protein